MKGAGRLRRAAAIAAAWTGGSVAGAVQEGNRFAQIFDDEVLRDVEHALGPAGAEAVRRACRTYATRVALFIGRCAAMSGEAFDPSAALLVGAIAPLYDGLFDEAVPRSSGTLTPELEAALGRLFDGVLESQDAVPEPLLSVFRLAEARLPRSTYPGAYACLARLHRAQILSRAQRACEPEVADEFIRACTEAKGRAATELLTSVIWSSGEDSRRTRLGALGYFLQLMDDWDDEAEDRRAGQETLVTRGKIGPLRILIELGRAVAPVLADEGWDPVAAHRFCAGLFWWWVWLAAKRGLRVGGRIRRMQRSGTLESFTRLA